MPYERYFWRHLSAIVYLIILSGCRHAPESNLHCDPALTGKYKELAAAQSGSLADARLLIRLYDTTNEACRSTIAADLAEDLFNILYTHQLYDTVIIPFYDRMAGNPSLSVQDRSKVLLRAATFYLYGLEEPGKALPYIEKAAAYYPQMNDSVKKGYYSVRAQFAMQESDLKEATAYYLKAIAICEKLKDSASLAATNSNFSTVYSRMGDYEKAAEMKKKSVAYFLGRKDYDRLIYGYIGVGTEYGLLRKYDSASYYNLLAIDLLEHKGVVNPNMAFLVYSNMAGIQMGMADYAKARYYYGKAREQLAVLKNPENERFYVMSSTPAFATTRPVDTEIRIIESYIPEFLGSRDYSRASGAYYTLQHIYYLQGNYKSALRNYIRYDSLKGLMADEENRKYVAEMETKYETQKKQLKIQVQQKEIKRQQAISALLAAGLITLVMATALFLTRLKLRRNKKDAAQQKQFTKKLLENIEEERIRIARDLHDGISQELMILKNQMEPEHQRYREKIDDVITDIRGISRDLHPVMLEKIGFEASVAHICEQMMENNFIFITSDIHYSGTLSKAGELQMFRMIQEALNNIIKYSQAEAAKVTISETEKFVMAEIIDNGRGFDVEKALNSRSSFGLMNLSERSKALNGKTVITSSNTGTIIKIEIPKSNVQDHNS